MKTTNTINCKNLFVDKYVKAIKGPFWLKFVNLCGKKYEIHRERKILLIFDIPYFMVSIVKAN